MTFRVLDRSPQKPLVDDSLELFVTQFPGRPESTIGVQHDHFLGCGIDEPDRRSLISLVEPVDLRSICCHVLTHGGTLITRVGSDVRWWTWAGYRANATLAATLPSVTDPLQRPTDCWVRLREDLTPADWHAAREGVGENLVLPDVDRRAVRGLKFSAALPERLAVATVAARLADFQSARAALEEPVRFQHDR